MDETSLVSISSLLMVIALIFSFVPIMPGPVLVWAVGMISAALLQFERVTPIAAAGMTIVMIVGVASDFWLPMLGVQSGGISCLTSIGSFIGGILGTFFIPIPILGTLLGCIIGAVVVEYMMRRRLRETVQAGKEAAKLFIIGYIVEVITSILIFVVFIVSIVTTG